MYLLFLAVWIILNGRITAEIIGIGCIVAAFLYWFVCKFMDYSFQKDILFLRKGYLFVRYGRVLVKEVLKANREVRTFVLSPKYQIEPQLIHYKTDLRTKFARVLLANSITLTPGTITVSLEGDELLIHCLDKTLAEGIEDSEFVELLRELEKGF